MLVRSSSRPPPLLAMRQTAKAPWGGSSLSAYLARLCTAFLCIAPGFPFTPPFHDRSFAPHPRLPHLQEAAGLLGRREGAVQARVRGDDGGERRVVHHRRRRIR